MVSHFDFIPFKDELYDLVSTDAVIDNYGANFEAFGYNSTLAVVNYGDAILTLLIFFASFFIYKIFSVLLTKLHI